MAEWRGWRVSRSADTGGAVVELATLTDADLMAGDVTIDVQFSSVNFKDALALTGRPGVIRSDSLIAGIDLVGVVAESASTEWAVGDRVLVNGRGIGETHHGGLAERARVPAEWLVRVPDTMTSGQAAAIGTAGFTAQLAVLALEQHGVDGEILVTGATGGVGSLSVALLATNGHSVTAATGKTSEHDYLRRLGATTIIDRAELSEPGKPLQSQRWAGAIDSLGGQTLATILAQTNYGGIVASCGLAASGDLPATVLPFILRAVTLVGINSVFTPHPVRAEAWARLSRDLDTELLDSMTAVIRLEGAVEHASNMIAGNARGRTVVAVSP